MTESLRDRRFFVPDAWDLLQLIWISVARFGSKRRPPHFPLVELVIQMSFNVHRLIIIVLVVAVITGCNQQPASQENLTKKAADDPSRVVVAGEAGDWAAFSNRWASASDEDRRSMANVMEIGSDPKAWQQC